jgi:hypothetical protein
MGKPKKKTTPAKKADPSSKTQGDIELAYASLVLYAEDGSLDKDEIKTLLHIALRDGSMTDREREILRGLFNRIREEDVTADAWTQLQTIREEYSI